MDSNEHDCITSDDNALTTSTLNTLQSWPHVDSTSLSIAQWHVFCLEDWSRTTFAGPTENHGLLPSAQTQTWHYPNREYRRNQQIQIGATWTSRLRPSTVTMPHGNVIPPCNIGEPALGETGPYQSTTTSYSDAVSQEPNQYTDPVIWMTSQYETCCRQPTSMSLPMDPEAVSSLGEGAETTERSKEPYSGPLPVQGRQRTCYDHGCHGREFSSISNLRRHQRERAGRTPLSFCCWCGAAFYRRWT
jgi:hypothetical protein